VVLLAVAACGSSAGASTSPRPSPSPSPSRGPVTTAAEAVAAVIVAEPRLTGIAARDPNLIGQGSWHEVSPASGVGACHVKVQDGRGDCPAVCINGHEWVYAVQPDGTAVLQSERGDVVPPEAWPSPGGDGRTGLMITASAGLVCPAEQDPPDPACAPRPVPGAVIVVRDAAGTEVARATLDAAGTAFVEVPAGGYVVEPQAVEGLMGTAPPASATVLDGAGTPVALAYDTGIR
jgi:hypothetical protein